jgi:hypothetical protein
MFWIRSLDWLIEHYPHNNELFWRFARNAYLKTRDAEGDRAFQYVEGKKIKKTVAKVCYKSRAFLRNCAKKLYLKLKT